MALRQESPPPEEHGKGYWIFTGVLLCLFVIGLVLL